MDRENSNIVSKVDKQKLLYEAKLEDVQFVAAEADQDDLEALDRSQEADKRQLNEIIKKNSRI
ncbi:YfhD family protein [Paenibacillus sp. FSL R7-0345]|uniref:YfhD family protein n=1 Tax=Paenibacillus sp. FSL R7-0345 TaxID=2954535 RepID=UPI003159D3B2